MELFDEVFECLRDGFWHSLYELSLKTRIGQLEVSKGMTVLSFLQENGFVHLNRLHTTVRLSRPVHNFLKEISAVEMDVQNEGA